MTTSTLNFGNASSAAAKVTKTTNAGQSRTRRALGAVWSALQAVGQQRSAAYLNHLADTHAESRPDFARRMRDAARGHYLD